MIWLHQSPLRGLLLHCRKLLNIFHMIERNHIKTSKEENKKKLWTGKLPRPLCLELLFSSSLMFDYGVLCLLMETLKGFAEMLSGFSFSSMSCTIRFSSPNRTIHNIHS